MIHLSRRLISLLFIVLLCACSSTRVQESWRLPGYQAGESQKVLIVAMASRESLRKVIETAFSDRETDLALRSQHLRRFQAQGGGLRAKNAATPAFASSPSHVATSSAMECSTASGPTFAPRCSASALARATAPGAQER